MRKLLLTTAFVLPLTMVPALAQDANATAEAPADATMPADETTAAGTDAAATDTMAAEDPAAEKEAMAAEVAASGKVAQQQAANELRLDWITDATVTSPTGDAIGDINDLIMDADTGQMVAAIVGVGGFLGIGEKQIAVPWDQLTVNYDAQEINSNLTKEEADAASEYVFRDRSDAPAVEVGDEVQPMDGTATAPADGTATDPAAMPAADGTASEATPADTEATMDGEAPASDMAPADGASAEAPAAEGETAAEGASESEMPAADAAETSEEKPAGN